MADMRRSRRQGKSILHHYYKGLSPTLKYSLPSVRLIDDGSLDTVVSVNGKEIRYDQEFAAQFRNKKTGGLTEKGWRLLKKQAIDDAEMMQ